MPWPAIENVRSNAGSAKSAKAVRAPRKRGAPTAPLRLRRSRTCTSTRRPSSPAASATSPTHSSRSVAPSCVDASKQFADTPDVVDDPAELPQLEHESDFEQLEDDVDVAEADFEGRGDEERAVARRHSRDRAAHPAQRREGSRVTNFLRGSWRELERVQWPDRRQVAQATAVVIGFVIVAGAFLGLMDLLASKIVDFII